MTGRATLSEQQVTFFRTFGFLKLPGLFRDDLGEIIAGFEEVFANDAHPRMETREVLHGEQRRLMIPQFIDKSVRMKWIRDDDRVAGVVTSLLGDYEYAESDGNLLDCETSWHCDIFGSPFRMRHVKLFFYLDPQRGDSGALRVIPGTQYHQESFARSLRPKVKDPHNILHEFGLDRTELPAVPIETDPGDVIALDFRTLHASFHGPEGRRLFTLNFRERRAVDAAATRRAI
jgi:hypothetical protein